MKPILEDIDNLIYEVSQKKFSMKEMWRHMWGAEHNPGVKWLTTEVPKHANQTLTAVKNIPNHIITTFKNHPKKAVAGTIATLLYKKYYDDENKRAKTNEKIKEIADKVINQNGRPIKSLIPTGVTNLSTNKIPDKKENSNLLKYGTVGLGLTGAGLLGAEYYKSKKQKEVPHHRNDGGTSKPSSS